MTTRLMLPLLTAAAVLWAPAAGAQEFGPLPPDAEIPRAVHRVVERLGRSALLIRRGVLLRRDLGSGGEVPLRTLAGQRLGRAHSLARDPLGGTYVAADGGVFLVAIESDVADAIPRGTGAPPGTPRAVFLDARRRLWVATDVAFGVIDPVWGFGRTWDLRAVGAPAPPFDGVVVRSDHVVLSGASGAGRFPLGARLPPELETVWLLPPAEERREAAPTPRDAPEGSLVLRQNTPFPWPYDEPISLRFFGVGQGGATFARVVDGHHRWLPLAGVPDAKDPSSYQLDLTGLAPGRRRVTVRVFDRELNWRDWNLLVDVQYPWFLEKSTVLLIAGAVMALVLGAALWGARVAGGGRRRTARALVSAGLVIWLLLQVLGALWPHARGWPFVGFSMYTGHFEENSVVSSVVLRRVTRGGRYLYARLENLGARDGRWQTVRPFLHADPATRRTRFLDRYNEARGGRPPIHGLVVVAERHRLTPDGPVNLPPVVMGGVTRGDGDDGR